MDSTPETRPGTAAERERGQAPGSPERREWNLPDYEDIDTTPEVTSYSARR